MAQTTGTRYSGETVLLYRPEFMDPSDPMGLWWCLDPEDVQAVTVNAVSKAVLASWEEVGPAAQWAQHRTLWTQ